MNLIFNNAGVALGSTIEAASYEDLEWIININLWGVIYGTKAFLPHLKASGEGHIINISSVFGLIGVPSQGAYNATKFAVRGWTEALIQYALGRRVGFTDERLITDIMNEARGQDYAVRSFIHALVNSQEFQSK